MKIAVASDDGNTIGQHFGRARRFVVLTIEGGTVEARETRDSNSVHGRPGAEERRHGDCFEVSSVIADCRALIVGGMGSGAFEKFRAAGIEPVLTDAHEVEEAALRYAKGDLPSLPGRLHRGGGHDRHD